jgi:hypothetical protein
VIVEPNSMGAYQVQRIELLGREPEQAAEQYLASAATGSTVHIIEDTKVSSYRVRATLEEIDDARLGHNEDDADTPVP